jgi:PII-like signaling protein
VITDALKLSVYFGEGVVVGPRIASDVLLERLAAHEIGTVILLRGLEGFGINRRIHAGRFPDVSTDLPLLAIAVAGRESVLRVLDDVDAAVPRGLLTLESARLVTGDDVADAEFPDDPGGAGKLTIVCGARERSGPLPAYRAVVALLRRHGATGAIVLPGVDGMVGGRRERVALWSVAPNVPMMIVSVGPPDLLRRSLPHLSEVLREPTVMLERVTQLKHDGRLIEPLPSPSAHHDGDVWQAIRVYTRRSAHVAGGALYTELGRRIREAGGAGVTTVLGDWGFSSDEPPHGDRLGRVVSHRPTYTVFVDRPERVRHLWPLIDDLTSEHGIVTSRLVPAYLERADGTVHGSLEQAELEAQEWVPDEAQRAAPRAVAEEPAWLAELRIRAERFASARGAHGPVVRVTLTDGESFLLWSAAGGPGAGFVTLVPHPERYDDLVPTDGDLLAPRAVIVPERAILKVELLTRAPRGARSLVLFETESV